jgi:tetratricopeptide (TPR) repeat protein
LTALDEPGSCPDPETLAAFMDGRLEGDAWRRVADHVQECDDCLFIIRGTTAFEREVERGAPARPSIRLPIAAGVVLAIIAAAAIMMQRNDPLRRMAAAVQKSGARTFEGRIAGIDYARYSALRSPERADPALQSSVRSILHRNEKPRSAKQWHAQGVAHLVLGHGRDAVAALAEAARLDPESAAYRSDLAAARIAHGTESGDAAVLRAALGDADQALRMKRTPEALFNRALALERMGDTAQASRAYADYVAADPQSRWSEEARWRVDRLNGQRH